MQGLARGGEHGVRNLERLSGVEPFECAISASSATESRKNRRKKSEVAPTTSEEV